MVQTYALVFLALALVSAYDGTQWTQVDEGALKQISVGPAGVWGISSAEGIFYREGTFGNSSSSGTRWVQLPGHLKQVDVGLNAVWGVNRLNDVYMRNGISLESPAGTDWVKLDMVNFNGVKVRGGLKHVSVSNSGKVWGVNSNDKIYFRKCNGVWIKIEGSLKQISVGEVGVWGVDANDEIWYRTGTYGDAEKEGTGWEKVGGGTMKYISSAKGVVIGTNSDNKIWRREGINGDTPTGTHWIPLDRPLNVIDALDTSTYWGVDSSNTWLIHSSTIMDKK